MKRIIALLAGGLILFFSAVPVFASHIWYVTSPDHGQTFTFGTESHRAWDASETNPRHLLLYLAYTNDPYVDEDTPRVNDSFSFNFPNIRLQPDGRTFSYVAPDGHAIPVARRRPGFLGFEETKLLPTSVLRIVKRHGYLTVSLWIVE